MAALAREAPPYSDEQLNDIARHCTLQEDNASKVERQVLKAAAAYLLDGRLGNVFDAIVTGAAAKGTFVRISSPLLEGRMVRGLTGWTWATLCVCVWWRWMLKKALSTLNGLEQGM